MRYTIATLVVLAAACAAARAGEVTVNWKISGGEFTAQNRLPPGATVKITVTYVPANVIAGTKFKVNGEEFTAKAKDDAFRAKVDQDGKLTIAGPALVPALTAGHLVYGLTWGSKKPNGEVDFALGLSVRVED
jgi:hypothetical protein